MRGRIILAAALALGVLLPAAAQDARNEPTFEDMVRGAMGPKNCDKIDLELVRIAQERWPAIGKILTELMPDPRNSALHTKLGNQFANLTLWTAAERSYRCAIQFDENNAQAWNNLGLVHLGRRELSNAIAALNRAVVVDPNYARAHYHLGMAYDADGAYDQAIRSYERAISLDPRLGLARFNPQVANNPHRLELFMRRLASEQVVRYNLGEPDEP